MAFEEKTLDKAIEDALLKLESVHSDIKKLLLQDLLKQDGYIIVSSRYFNSLVDKAEVTKTRNY